MISPDFHDYFLGSVGASAALIGLLFVALSITPEQIVRPDTSANRRTLAFGAFTALLNVFFLSTHALIPNRNVGSAAIFMGSHGFISNLFMSFRLFHSLHYPLKTAQLTQLLGSCFVYGLELALAVRLIQFPLETKFVSALAMMLIGIYAIGLGRAWQLLGESSLKIYTPVSSQRSRKICVHRIDPTLLNSRTKS